MKRLYFLPLFFLLNTLTWGQNINVVDNMSVSGCIGSASFVDWNTYPGTNWTFSWYHDSTQIAGNVPFINGLCAGNYSLVFDSLGTVVATESFTINSPCAASNLTAVIQMLSADTGTCSGALSGNGSGGTAPYSYLWSIAASTQNLYNLCAGQGTYELIVIDAMGCQSASASYNLPLLSNILSNLSLVDDTSGSCNGSASCSPSGGMAPYTISWSNGQSGNTISNLCSNYFTVTITDQTGDSLIQPFFIYDNSNTYWNTIYNDSIPVDTLYGNLITNCTIDYSTIDSTSLSQAVYDSISQNLYLTWIISDSSGNISYLHDTIGFNGGIGVYTINVMVYCPNKSITRFFKIISDFYFNGSTTTLAVNSPELERLSVYPNPFTDGFLIANPDNKVSAYTLVDLNGRILASSSKTPDGSIPINGLAHLSQGTYLLLVTGINGTQQTIKLIK